MAQGFELDKATILDRLGGDEEIFAVMVDMFLQDAEGYGAQLMAAFNAGDAPLLTREAHTLKGLLATFADNDGADVAAGIEHQARGGDLSGLEAPVNGLLARLRLVAEVLREEVAAG